MYDPGTIYIPPGYGKITFSRVEMKNIGLAIGALTLAFTMFMFLGYRSIGGLSGLSLFLYAAGVSFLAVLSGFMLHEFAHKFVAQRSGAWAEFRAYPLGLLLAVMFSFLGFIFAAPGAVYIQGMISKKQNGLISIAGPLTNIGLGVLFLGCSLITDGLLQFAFIWLGSTNILLAAFNMLPIPPFDGYKVLKWNIPVYIVTFGTAVVLAFLMYTRFLY